ncbi:TonB-dependent receptor [Chryseobacterium formosense]|uniref:TonB-dependent receptor n=1 Tax=Chryseobacterium formosense TaxID=236814 RepID=A0A085Z8D4_9FLAO|nr:SusC/RagA family TonB-linked outer membrane protein [Chryseobacterium formosense]KFF00698.1 TonB-dependent receptor [Chryseobacterium formosense]SFT36789.1 TonB-linked outer membrane protein, SusC/RagA family [Chryseobacterium formosense]
MKNSYYKIGGIFFGLMLTAVSTNTKAQTRTISGTVTASNKPLSGVTISQEGSNQVTTTSENGTYTLQVSAENPILLFRHPDYAEERITATNQTVVNISLEQKVKGIEEVILNAGYYKVKDKERTGSIAKVSAKDIENQPVTNVLSAAQGRMAGVNITQNSGVAGGGYDVQIRGRNSLRTLSNSAVDGNQPLYVLDGVPMSSPVTSVFSTQILPFQNINPLNSINPNDIESLEILKDADATAIYGSRGANGVILITTKKGNKNKSKISISSSLAFSSVASRLNMMDTSEYIAMRKSAFGNDNISTYPATAYDVNDAWDGNRYTDWQKTLIGKTATTSNTSVGLSGGSDGWTYRINATHNEQTTVYPADYQYKNNVLSMGFTHRSKDNKLNILLSNNFSQQFNNVINEDLTNISLFLSPNAPALYNADGSLNWQNNTFTNPMASTVVTYQNDSKQINNSLNVSYQILPNISFSVNSGFNYQNFEEFNLRPHTRYNPAFNFTSATGSSTFTSSFSSFSYNIEPQLNADYRIGKGKLNVLIGATLNSSESKQSSIQGSGFESNALMMNINAAKTKIFSDIISKEYKYMAVFGRINYQLDNKYIINVTARRDGSSRFGPNNRFANFGAVGAAWLFSKENFLSNTSWLSFGKLRGSYGIAGSDNIGDAQYRDTYSVASTSIYNGVVGLVPTRLFNGNFSWEKTKKLELALETSFFKERIGLNVSYYKNRSDNQLVGLPLPSTTGFSSVQANLDATVENKGWEFELRTSPIKTKTFSWQSDLNLTIPKNTLLAFPNLEGSTYANQYVIGQSTSIVKLYDFLGINPATGLYSFTDVNGDGKISSPDDNKSIEDLSVKFYGGWSNRFSYKNWDLSFLIQFTKQRNYNYHSYMPVAGTMNNQAQEVTDVWSPSNPTGYYMPYSTGANAGKNAAHANFMRSTASVGDASFIRLKNVQLNYKIPVELASTQVVIYVQGQNVLTLTKYFGVDPEFVATGFLPPLKTWSIGTQINF